MCYIKEVFSSLKKSLSVWDDFSLRRHTNSRKDFNFDEVLFICCLSFVAGVLSTES